MIPFTSDINGIKESQRDLSDSDEDGVLTAVGDIPTEWYRDFSHIGYDLEGKRVLKPASGDQLDKFLEGVEDPSGLWKSVRMPDLPGTDLLLSEKEMEMVQRIQKADYPDSEFDPYPPPPPTIEFYTSEKMETPLIGADEPKRRFIPSKWEHQKVMKLVVAIRNGWIKPRKEFEIEEKPYFHLLWSDTPDDDKSSKDTLPHIPAPKLRLSGHRESYRPHPSTSPPQERRRSGTERTSERESWVSSFPPSMPPC